MAEVFFKVALFPMQDLFMTVFFKVDSDSVFRLGTSGWEDGMQLEQDIQEMISKNGDTQFFIKDFTKPSEAWNILSFTILSPDIKDKRSKTLMLNQLFLFSQVMGIQLPGDYALFVKAISDPEELKRMLSKVLPNIDSVH